MRIYLLISLLLYSLFHFNLFYNHNYNKILKSDWLSTALILALILDSLIGQYAPSRARINGFFSLSGKKILEFLVF